MIRNDEAIVASSSITLKKTIYVEGVFDYRIVKDFLRNKEISNVKVIEIGEYINDSHLPVEERELAKEKIINLIQRSNIDVSLKNKYMGIVDLDYDHFLNKPKIDNLYSTDMNAMESYFLDYELISALLEENNIGNLTEKEFYKWLDGTVLFSSYFYFQLVNFSNLEKEDHLSFSELSISNDVFTCYERKKILLTNILRFKTSSYPRTIPLFFNFLKSLDRHEIAKIKMLFLHGKHTLRFVIGLLKRFFESLRNLKNEHIMNQLKDKFIMFHFCDNYQLFNQIRAFAIT